MTAKVELREIPAVNLANYDLIIAKIKSTMLGREDHGIFTFMLELDYGGSMQGAGGFALDGNSTTWGRTERGYQSAERVGIGASLTQIMQVLDACGVDRWEKLPGRTIYALREKGDGMEVWGGKVVGLAPLPTENGRAMVFTDVFKRYPTE